MNLLAFRMLLFYITIAFVMPQVRFRFLWPLQIANISAISAMVLHVVSAAHEGSPLIRFGPATILVIFLSICSLFSHYTGLMVTDTSWNDLIADTLKNCIIVVLIEAMAYNVQRVWAILASVMLSTLWWLKAGVRLTLGGGFLEGSRILGPAVGLVENPNAFAYFMSVTLLIYMLFYQQATRKWVRGVLLTMFFLGVYSVFNTGSRTGLLTLITVGIIIVLKYGGRYKKSLLLSAVVIYFVFVALDPSNIARFKTIGPTYRMFFLGEYEGDYKDLNPDELSALMRAWKNRDTWRLIKNYPLFGVGFNPSPQLVAEEYGWAGGRTHSEPLAAGKQMGFPGMGMYFSFHLILFMLGLKVMMSSRRTWPAVSSMGWTFMLLSPALMVGGYFGINPWNIYLMIMAAGASSLWMAWKDYERSAADVQNGQR